MKKKLGKKRIIRYSIIAGAILVVILIGFMIYKNLFAGTNSSRYDGIENYNLTNEEKNNITERINELDNVKSVDVYITSKIIKILVKLSDDVDFAKVQDVSNQVLSDISEDNLSFYDVEIFFESENKDSDVYPKIGYKHKKNTEFSW